MSTCVGRRIQRVTSGALNGTQGQVISETAERIRVCWDLTDGRLNSRGRTSHLARTAEGVRWKFID